MIILIYLLAIVSIVLLIALLLPSSYTISKTITVGAKIEDCYEKIANLNNYKDWNPFAQMEPNAIGVISGSPNTIGHQYTWDGKKIGTFDNEVSENQMTINVNELPAGIYTLQINTTENTFSKKLLFDDNFHGY